MENESDEVADKADGFEPGELGADDAQSFSEVAADAEHQECPDEDIVLKAGVFPPEAVTTDYVASIECHSETDDEQQS